MSKIRKSEINHKFHSGKSGIYMFTNSINGKVYVGQSVDVYKRYSNHKRSINTKSNNQTILVSAFKKYGFDSFNFSIIEFVEYAELTSREQFWMDFYKSNIKEFGYNSCPAAGSAYGYKHTEETKNKVSMAAKGRFHTEETKKIMSAIKTGTKLSESTKRKISEVQKGKKVPNKKGTYLEQISKDGLKVIATFISAMQAQRSIGKSTASNIIAASKGIRPSAGGYLWRCVCQK